MRNNNVSIMTKHLKLKLDVLEQYSKGNKTDDIYPVSDLIYVQLDEIAEYASKAANKIKDEYYERW